MLSTEKCIFIHEKLSFYVLSITNIFTFTCLNLIMCGLLKFKYFMYFRDILVISKLTKSRTVKQMAFFKSEQ